MIAYFSSPNARIRYLSDASYWGYLVHLPIIGFFQIMVAQYDITWSLKLILIFVPSIILLMLSYRYGVRNTWLGFLLNGEKKTGKESTVLKLVPRKSV
jgi:glucans biosynthesis protein C